MEEVKKIADALNAKIDGFESKMTETQSKIEELKSKGEATERLENELKSFNENHTKSTNELAELIKKQQSHLDNLDVKMQKGYAPKESELKEKLTANFDKLKAMAKNGAQGEVSFEAKADLTIASNISGDVPAFNKLGGVFYNPTRPVHIREHLRVIPLDGDTMYYDQETAYTDNAAVRGEGSTAAQTEFTITEQSKTVTNISTYLTLSKEMFSDVKFVEAYIKTRVLGKLMSKEDKQLLYGTGSSNQVSGITTNATSYSDLLADSTVNRYDVLANAVVNAMNNEYRPTDIFLNPTDYLKLVSEKDSQGLPVIPNFYLGNSPINIHGATVRVSTAVTAGDFIIGDFLGGATMGLRENANFIISNLNGTNLIDGKVTIMVNERLTLGVHNTQAFIYGDFASALAQGTA